MINKQSNQNITAYREFPPLTRKTLFATVSFAALLLGAQETLAQRVMANGTTEEASGTINTGTATAPSGYGLYAVNNGIITSSTPLTVITGGNSTTAAYAERGGQITIAAGSTITANGGGSSAGISASGTGTGDTLSTITATDTTITSSGTYAVSALAGGVVNLIGGSVTNNTGNGVYAWQGSATINATDVAVTVNGSNVYGVQANADGIVHLNGGSVTTSGANGYGIGTAGSGSTLTANGTSIITSGVSAIGAYARRGKMTLTDVTVATTGRGAHGAMLQSGGQLDVTGGSLMANGNGAAALNAETNIPDTVDENNNTATITDSTLASQNGAGIVTNGTTLNASFNNSSLSGNSALLQTVGGGTLNLTADNSVFTGAVTTELSSGSTTNLTLSNETLWNVTGNSNLNDLVNTGSTIDFASPTGDSSVASSYKTLTVSGDYTSNEGVLKLNTHLGSDSSATDLLFFDLIETGIYFVVVTNTNGTGVQTLEGIELITTGGSDADAFVQDGRIVAGSYDYSLQQGNASGGNLDNWYLTSKRNEDDTYRPEVGGYANNLAAASTMFNTRLNDRHGEGYYIDGETGKRSGTNFWLRYEGSHNKNKMLGGQLKNTGNRTVLQIGGDFLGGSFSDNDQWRLGVMGGYGHQNTKTYNTLSGHRADATISGYTAGVYGTWYQNGQDHSGIFVDSWLQYNWFNNTVDGNQLQSEKYKSKGFSASIEGGYNLRAGNVTGLGGIEHNVFIRPQGQVIWSGVRADSYTEANGTQVNGLGHNNVQTRIGMRISLSPSDKQASKNLMPYLEANWINNSKKYGVEMGSVKNYIEGSRNLGELKIGVESRFNDNFSAWASLGHQIGSNSYRETNGVIGVKYRF